MVCHMHSFTGADLDRLLDWFHVLESRRDTDVVLADYMLAERIRNARADLNAGQAR